MMDEEEAFDPWETSIHGIKVMSPAEDAMWRRFEHFMRDNYGWGWSIELDASPSPKQKQLLEVMEKLGKAHAQSITDLAIDLLTDE